MVEFILEDRVVKPPSRKYATDAGIDLAACEDAVIPAHSFKSVHTGVHVILPKGTAGLISSRSGMNFHHGILSEAVVDEGYTGELAINLHNNSDEDYIVNKGDRITQLVIVPVVQDDIKFVKHTEPTERGNSGLGSSGK
jgi:dUTP pyrophosphatase